MNDKLIKVKKQEFNDLLGKRNKLMHEVELMNEELDLKEAYIRELSTPTQAQTERVIDAMIELSADELILLIDKALGGK